SAMFVWFVHATRLLRMESVTETLYRLAKIDGETTGLQSISSWALQFVGILATYRLDSCPQLIRKCWSMEPMLSTTVPSVRTWQTVHAVDAEVIPKYPLPHFDSAWIHYDPQKDTLFCIDLQSTSLRIHCMNSNLSMRPGSIPVPTEHCSSLCGAAVSSSSQFVAAIFNSDSSGFFLICWRLPRHGSDAILQPEIILHERFHAKFFAVPSLHGPPSPFPFDWYNNVKNCITFIGDDVLVAPPGVWDLKSGEWLTVPSASLYQEIDMRCVSGSGRRIAQICENGNEISFTETQTGTIISQLPFSDADYLHPLAFSYSGQKLVFYRYLLRPTKMVRGCDKAKWCTGFGHRISCLIVDDQTSIDLLTPYHIHIKGAMQPRFSKDEETIVAFLSSCGTYEEQCAHGGAIGLWKLVKDTEGRYAHASFSHLFKGWYLNISFCLIPSLHDGPDNVGVLTGGTFHQRPLNITWTEDEETAFLYRKPFAKRQFVEVDPKEMIVTVKTVLPLQYVRTLSFLSTAKTDTWAIGSRPFQLMATSTCTLDTPRKTELSWSSKAMYTIEDETLLQQVFDSDAVTVLEPNRQARLLLSTHEGIIRAVAFSAEDRRVALLYNRNGIATLVVNDIRDGSICTIGTSKIEASKKWVFKTLEFSPVDSSQFCLVMETYDNILITYYFKLLKQELISTKIESSYNDWNIINPPATPSFPPLGPLRTVRAGCAIRHVRFSVCGGYLVWYSGHSVYRVYSTMQISNEDLNTHPVLTNDDRPFIYDQHVFTVKYDLADRHIYLHRQPLRDLRHSMARLLCLVPKSAGSKFFLIWPEDSEDEVKIVVVDGDPVVIETGILSRDLMEGDAWYTHYVKRTGRLRARLDPQPYHTSIRTGQIWVDELLNGHHLHMRRNLGMHRHVFVRLIRTLHEKSGFSATRNVTAEESLAIFLHMVVKDNTIEDECEVFQRSPDTQKSFPNIPYRFVDEARNYPRTYWGFFCGAAVSSSSQFVAAIFNSDSSGFFLICWRLPRHGSDAILQPEIILHERFHAEFFAVPSLHGPPSPPPFSLYNNVKNCLAIIGDDVLVAPPGMWDLKSGEWLLGPSASLYQKIDMRCVSGSGRRQEGGLLKFARTEMKSASLKHKLEPFSHSSNSQMPTTFILWRLAIPVKSLSFINIYHVTLKMFGGAATQTGAVQDLVIALLVSLTKPRLTFSHHITTILKPPRSPNFRRILDEETIVACLQPCPARDAQHPYDGVICAIGLWNLVKDTQGRYKVDPKEMIVTVKTLVPLQSSNKSKHSVLSKKWAIGSRPDQLLATSTCTLDTPRETKLSWSSKAMYAVEDETLLQVFDIDAVTVLEPNRQARLVLSTHQGMIRAVAFSAEDRRVALLYSNRSNNSITLVLNDIRDGSICTIATSKIEATKWVFKRLKFSPVDSSQFCLVLDNDYVLITYYFKLLDQELISTKFESSHDKIVKRPPFRFFSTRGSNRHVRFSTCGGYLVWYSSHFSKPNRVYSTMQISNEALNTHPVLTKDNRPFIYDQHVFSIHFDRPCRHIYLHRQPLGNLRNSMARLLCLVPESAGSKSFLIWPEDGEDEVKIVVVDGDPVVIETGILSRDLMEGDAWYTTY
ncbi:hypothetical protein H0H93_002753, partial [Arthromyces matolae]